MLCNDELLVLEPDGSNLNNKAISKFKMKLGNQGWLGFINDPITNPYNDFSIVKSESEAIIIERTIPSVYSPDFHQYEFYTDRTSRKRLAIDFYYLDTPRILFANRPEEVVNSWGLIDNEFVSTCRLRSLNFRLAVNQENKIVAELVSNIKVSFVPL